MANSYRHIPTPLLSPSSQNWHQCQKTLSPCWRSGQRTSKSRKLEEITFLNLPATSSHLHASNFSSSLLMQDDSKKTTEVSIDMEFRASQQLQLINEQESYIQSRADTMQNIESTIVELGSTPAADPHGEGAGRDCAEN